jgi:hypothetical protein
VHYVEPTEGARLKAAEEKVTVKDRRGFYCRSNSHFAAVALYVRAMLQRTLPAGFIAPCLPTKATTLPSGRLWIHEIKHDGLRLLARKDGERVRLFSVAAAAVAAEGRFPMKTVAEVISVSRSNLADRLQERSKKRIGGAPLPDDELASKIKAVIAEVATYGYRRVHAVLKRQALAAGLKPPNHKRV